MVYVHSYPENLDVSLSTQIYVMHCTTGTPFGEMAEVKICEFFQGVYFDLL